MSTIYKDYFPDHDAFDTQDGAYKELKVPDVPESPLRVPELLKPDKETDDGVWYTVIAQTGEVQMLPGAKTKTWGYNEDYLGKIPVFPKGKTIHLRLINHLPEMTTFHWHGLNIPGPYEDGGCHAPVYPGQEKDIKFKIIQPASMCWLHAHPCPETAHQVFRGLAGGAIITDDVESKLPFPRNYGVDDIPLILQDRNFHANNQWNYREDYDPDGVTGTTPLINGTVNPYFDVTTQRLRLRVLDGANRREFRLHFDDGRVLTQIASDCGTLEHPVKMAKVMITCAERQQFIVDFGDCKPGDVVTLMSDDTPLVKFRIHEFKPDDTQLPDNLTPMKPYKITPDLPVHKCVMDGMDEYVMMDGKKFNMQRIDFKATLGTAQLWEVVNNNTAGHGMIHPFHMHGPAFQIVSRNGKAPYPNECGPKDVVAVNPGEHVIIRVLYNLPGVYMYHCHILEHEDGGMMAQLQIVDPKDPNKQYKLMDHQTLMKAFSEERGVPMDKLWLGGMQSYAKMGMHM